MATAKVKLIPILLKRPLLNKAQFVAALTSAMQGTVTEGLRLAATYPPQTLTKTGYRRTGTLGRSWSPKVQQTGGSIVGIVGSNKNIAPYNQDVQGAPGQQKPLFAGANWPGVERIKKRMEKELRRRAPRAVRRVVRS